MAHACMRGATRRAAVPASHAAVWPPRCCWSPAHLAAQVQGAAVQVDREVGVAEVAHVGLRVDQALELAHRGVEAAPAACACRERCQGSGMGCCRQAGSLLLLRQALVQVLPEQHLPARPAAWRCTGGATHITATRRRGMGPGRAGWHACGRAVPAAKGCRPRWSEAIAARPRAALDDRARRNREN